MVKKTSRPVFKYQIYLICFLGAFGHDLKNKFDTKTDAIRKVV